MKQKSTIVVQEEDMTTSEKGIRTSSPDSMRMIQSFFENHPEAVLATIGEDGLPHTAVIYITVNGKFETIFVAKKDTVKYKNLLHNQNVSLTCFDGFSRATVTISGKAKQIGDKQEQERWIKALEDTTARGDRTHTPPYISINLDDFAVYKIYPETIHMVTYLRLNSGMYDFHESIEFVAKGH